jgi:hypothetical protein
MLTPNAAGPVPNKVLARACRRHCISYPIVDFLSLKHEFSSGEVSEQQSLEVNVSCGGSLIVQLRAQAIDSLDPHDPLSALHLDAPTPASP